MEIRDRRVKDVLGEAEFVHVAVEGRHGPHVTPVVFDWGSDRIWLVTERRSAKVRAMRRHPRVAGVARDGAREVAFTGRAEIIDPVRGKGLDALLDLPFALGGYFGRNLDHVAGVLRSAGPDPILLLDRVVVRVRLRSAALVEGGRLVRDWGRWPADDAAPAGSTDPVTVPRLDDLPARCRRLLTAGPVPAVLGWLTDAGPVALPAVWDPDRGAAVVDPSLLGLAGVESPGSASLTVDEGGTRLTSKQGVLLQGRGTVGAGGTVGLTVDRLTWWRGDRSEALTPAAVPVP